MGAKQLLPHSSPVSRLMARKEEEFVKTPPFCGIDSDRLA